MVVTAGETVIEFPVPAEVPPQEPENHWATAPAPGEPPTRVSVVLLPAHTALFPEMLVGATEEL